MWRQFEILTRCNTGENHLLKKSGSTKLHEPVLTKANPTSYVRTIGSFVTNKLGGRAEEGRMYTHIVSRHGEPVNIPALVSQGN
jgi:hypothetical protein